MYNIIIIIDVLWTAQYRSWKCQRRRNILETHIKTACHEFFKEYYDSKIQKRREQINYNDMNNFSEPKIPNSIYFHRFYYVLQLFFNYIQYTIDIILLQTII